MHSSVCNPVRRSRPKPLLNLVKAVIFQKERFPILPTAISCILMNTLASLYGAQWSLFIEVCFAIRPPIACWIYICNMTIQVLHKQIWRSTASVKNLPRHCPWRCWYSPVSINHLKSQEITFSEASTTLGLLSKEH